MPLCAACCGMSQRTATRSDSAGCTHTAHMHGPQLCLGPALPCPLLPTCLMSSELMCGGVARLGVSASGSSATTAARACSETCTRRAGPAPVIHPCTSS
jgi:hypothetical protein